MNLGQREVQANMVSVYDKLGDYLTYVEGSTFFYSEAAGIEETTIPDDTSGTKFPLDEDGFDIPIVLPRRGGIMDITFQVRMADLDNITLLPVQNVGHLVLPGGNTKLPFKARTQVIFNPSVRIENTAYLGSDSGQTCESEGEEVARGSKDGTRQARSFPHVSSYSRCGIFGCVLLQGDEYWRVLPT